MFRRFAIAAGQTRKVSLAAARIHGESKWSNHSMKRAQPESNSVQSRDNNGRSTYRGGCRRPRAGRTRRPRNAGDTALPTPHLRGATGVRAGAYSEQVPGAQPGRGRGIPIGRPTARTSINNHRRIRTRKNVRPTRLGWQLVKVGMLAVSILTDISAARPSGTPCCSGRGRRSKADKRHRS
jgi:hypothetical protein